MNTAEQVVATLTNLYKASGLSPKTVADPRVAFGVVINTPSPDGTLNQCRLAEAVAIAGAVLRNLGYTSTKVEAPAGLFL